MKAGPTVRGLRYAVAVSTIAFMGLLAHATYVRAAEEGPDKKCTASECGGEPCILCKGAGSTCKYHANCQ